MVSSAHTRRSPGTGGDGSRSQVLNIGEVLAELSSDFPQTTASKIRFLEEKGLVTPQRTAADIFLDDVTVSRKHAEFVREGTTFVVRDIGSLNGTYVNRSRIDESVLRSGDEVQIGKYRMTFHPSPHRDAAGA